MSARTTYENIKRVCREVKEIGSAIAVMLVVFILAAVSLHLPGWLRGVDHIQNQLQVTADRVAAAAETSSMSSTELLNVLGTVNYKLLPRATETLNKTNTLLGTANTTLTTVNTTIDDVSPKLTQTLGHLDAQVTAIGNGTVGVLSSTKASLDEIPPTLRAAQGTMNAGTAFLNGPLTSNSQNVDRVLKPFGMFVSDTQFKAHELMFGAGCPPDKQDCPKPPVSNWVKTYRVLKGLTPFAQPAYYGTKLFFEFGQ